MRFFISCFLLFIGGLLICPKCKAKVSLADTKPLVIPVDNVTPTFTSKDMAKFVPCDASVRGSSTSTMMYRIADKSFNVWFNSPAVKSSLLGRAVDETQEKLKTDVIVPADSAEGVTHKFSFRIEAFQALAKLEYTGWMKAAINYDAKAAATDVSFKEKLFSDKELVLSHKGNKEQGLSMIGLAWQW